MGGGLSRRGYGKRGLAFCKGLYVERESKRIFDELGEENYLIGIGDRTRLAERIAHYQCELIALHPFYELNGRIVRLFFDLIAVKNGFLPIDYSEHSPEEYIKASIECVQRADCSKLKKIIFDGLERK